MPALPPFPVRMFIQEYDEVYTNVVNHIPSMNDLSDQVLDKLSRELGFLLLVAPKPTIRLVLLFCLEAGPLVPSVAKARISMQTPFHRFTSRFFVAYRPSTSSECTHGASRLATSYYTSRCSAASSTHRAKPETFVWTQAMALSALNISSQTCRRLASRKPVSVLEKSDG